MNGLIGQPDISKASTHNKDAMDGDIILFNGKRCRVSLLGHQGTYCSDPDTGRAINVAQGNGGYLQDIDNPNSAPFNAVWSNKTEILVRRYPHLFQR